ncbi:hypothetical protein [Methanobrevibacter sp.]|uniref:hypothetical protein n=1 Tax=Methanobrevibacter sp. TaxID=66852 RepID=UPI00388D4E7A
MNINDDELEDETENTDLCPECKTFTIQLSQNRSYEYCTECGLITRASYSYVAGQKIELPYGLLII